LSRTVLIHAEAAHIRLQMFDMLRGVARVLPGGSSPIRALRAQRPDVVLVAVRRRDRQQCLALARNIKTDGRQPPLVGLVDPEGALSDPSTACERSASDGCVSGPLDAELLTEFLARLGEPGILLLGVRKSGRPGWRGR